MSFIPTIPRTLDTGDSNLRWLKSYLEGWIERKTEIRVSHEQHEGHWHGGIDRYGALGALLETDGSFDPLYLLSDDWTQVSKVHSRDAIEGVLTGIASVSYEGYNAFVLYLNQMAKLHALVWDTEETEGDRRSAQAEYQRHARPTRESFKTLIEGYLAQVLADTSTSKDRLAERLVEIAEQHRRWLLGGTGSPRSSQEESASDAIEGHVRSGIIAIQRQPQLTGAQTEFERARLAVLGVTWTGWLRASGWRAPRTTCARGASSPRWRTGRRPSSRATSRRTCRTWTSRSGSSRSASTRPSWSGGAPRTFGAPSASGYTGRWQGPPGRRTSS